MTLNVSVKLSGKHDSNGMCLSWEMQSELKVCVSQLCKQKPVL